MARLSAVVALLAALAAIAGVSHAAPVPIRGSGMEARLDALAAAATAARSGGPAAAQGRYDLARDTEEALARVAPSSMCVRLHDAIALVARGSVIAAEGFDRADRSLGARGESLIRTGTARLAGARVRCPGGIHPAGRASTGSAALVAPAAEEAFFGVVHVRVPRAARDLVLRFRGSIAVSESRPSAGLRSFRLPFAYAPGRGVLNVAFAVGRGRVEQSRSVWLLPRDARPPVGAVRRDASLDARLARAAAGFDGIAGIYVRDLATGATGSWNDTARFPAASTVKLGVLAAALAREPRPETSPLLYDMRALAAWSSNLAANRLLRSLGNGDAARGSAAAEAMLRRLGATQSTYPGEYRVGTVRRAAPVAPPVISRRTTTALDLGRMLARLQVAAAGGRASPLSAHAARIALALLLDSQERGDNVGLLRPALPARMPVAQKQGWISSARHTAAIVYGPGGPVIVVVLTYREGLSLGAAQALGRKVIAAAETR